jgi:hypothetical protein
MNVSASPTTLRIFLRVLGARHWIVGVFLVLTVTGIYGATRIPDDPAIERLSVAGDPIARATLDFERLFAEGDQALLMLESPHPLDLDALRGADRLERDLAKIAHVEARSLLDLYRRGAAAGEITPEEAQRLKTFATGTPLFRRAGLLGPAYLGIALELRVNSPAERDRALAAIDSRVAAETVGRPFTAIRRVGSAWLDAWLERQTGSSLEYF